MAIFFVNCPLHFENHLAEEIKSFWFEMMDLDGQPTRQPLPEFEIVPGGIEIKCPDHLGYQINFFSKLALRVLIRIHRFAARFYDQFEKEMKALPLDKWIDDKNVSVKIETAKSRLNHERNLIEAATKALSASGYKLISEAKNKIYIRIVKDKLGLQAGQLRRIGGKFFRGLAQLVGFRNILGIIDGEKLAAAELQRVVQGAGLGLGLSRRHHDHLVMRGKPDPRHRPLHEDVALLEDELDVEQMAWII